METSFLRTSIRRAFNARTEPSLWQGVRHSPRPMNRQPRRHLASPTHQEQPDFQAAPPVQFTRRRNSFSSGQRRPSSARPDDEEVAFLSRLRVVPASPSYYTATPHYLDDVLHLTALLRRYQTLPRLPLAEAPKIAWTRLPEYKIEVGEPIRVKAWGALQQLLKRLNCIHPSVVPMEVLEALEKFKRQVQPHENQAKPILIDEFGRASAVGRRKSSSAKVFVVEGDGQCMVNGRSLTEYFGRLHDRESAVWPLKATARLDKYNIFALVRGGGTTGQAEAITLGLARALLAHEPDLKPALRKAGCVTRDPRRVERKKPGHLKARKMPTWVKR